MFFIQIDYGIHNFVLIWSTITYVCVASNDVDDKCNQLQIQLDKCNPECWLETSCALLSKKESSAKQKKYCKLIGPYWLPKTYNPFYETFTIDNYVGNLPMTSHRRKWYNQWEVGIVLECSYKKGHFLTIQSSYTLFCLFYIIMFI